MRRLALLALTASIVTVTAAASAQAAPKTWHVKVTNLTAQQPMSPPVWAVHDKRIDIWSSGQLASSGVLPIVEDAVNGPLLTYLGSNSHVRASAAETGTPAGPIPPGASREFDVTSNGGDRYLTMLWMLVRTNDAFTGVDSYALDRGKRKRRGRKSGANTNRTRTIQLRAYDAGTENNNQSCAYIPGPPCSMPGVRDATAAAIAPHPGITGGDILPFAWDTSQPVASVEITRTQP
jgi:hypothetical protein